MFPRFETSIITVNGSVKIKADFALNTAKNKKKLNNTTSTPTIVLKQIKFKVS